MSTTAATIWHLFYSETSKTKVVDPGGGKSLIILLALGSETVEVRSKR